MLFKIQLPFHYYLFTSKKTQNLRFPALLLVPKAGLAPLRSSASGSAAITPSPKNNSPNCFLNGLFKSNMFYNKKSEINPLFIMVPKAGLEPAHGCPYWILSPARLPFHHFGIILLTILILSYKIAFCNNFKKI